MEIIVEEFIKSEKLLQILIKLLNPQILFCKSETSLQIQELSLNLENILQIWKNILQIIARNSEPLPPAKRDETLPYALFLFIGKCMEMIV